MDAKDIRPLRRIPFLDQPKMHESHWSRQRYRPIVPVLQGRTVPAVYSALAEAKARYVQIILLLFKPWRNLEDLLPSEYCVGVLGKT